MDKPGGTKLEEELGYKGNGMERKFLGDSYDAV
jgi:hypothetical protein